MTTHPSELEVKRLPYRGLLLRGDVLSDSIRTPLFSRLQALKLEFRASAICTREKGNLEDEGCCLEGRNVSNGSESGSGFDGELLQRQGRRG